MIVQWRGLSDGHDFLGHLAANQSDGMHLDSCAAPLG
jgi:hypothetical protein